MFVPHVPQMWYKCGTQMGPHTFFRYIQYYSTDELQKAARPLTNLNPQSSILSSQSSLYHKVCRTVQGRRRLNHNFCSKKLPRFSQGMLIFRPFDDVSMVKLEKILKLRPKKCGINLLLKIKTSSSSSSIELFYEYDLQSY